MAEPAYKAISVAKCKERESKIPQKWRITLPEDDDNLMGLPRECGIFSEEELTETVDSVALLDKIHSGIYTSFAVTQAFCKVSYVGTRTAKSTMLIFSIVSSCSSAGSKLPHRNLLRRSALARSVLG